MQDLRNMESWEAMQFAIEVSGMTRKELALALGVSVGCVNRYCSREDRHEPSLDMIRRICLCLGNAVLLRWVEAKLDSSEESVPAPQSRAQVLTAIARAGAALGDAHRLAADTEARGITPADARDMRAALLDVIGEARLVMAMLQHLAEHRDVTTCAPLASVRPQRKPWWSRILGRRES